MLVRLVKKKGLKNNIFLKVLHVSLFILLRGIFDSPTGNI
jgi:hypothetical protein